MAYILTVVVALAGLAWWLVTGVARGARKRDSIILKRLDPIAQKLKKGAAVTTSEVDALADTLENRPLLYAVLDQYKRLDLFPTRCLGVPEQAKAKLAYWMMHPNELRAAPAEMTVVESIDRTFHGKRAQFIVLRYRMPDGHWAGTDWILGLAGPFFDGEAPYVSSAAAFSRAGDREGSIQPAALVDWYVEHHGSQRGSTPTI
jgi:hypothetical protein